MKSSCCNKRSQNTERLALIVTIVALISLMVGMAVIDDWQEMALLAAIQAGGAAVTFFIVNELFDHTADRRLLNCTILPKVRSRVNSVARAALEDARQQGWLTDGSLEGAYLSGANLARANLNEADLKDALLAAANLQGASLRQTNLGGAHLYRANLRDAQLQGANLSQANMQSASLLGAQLDTQTILPDGARWRPGADLGRFTNPDHPNAWQRNGSREEPVVELTSLPWASSDSAPRQPEPAHHE